MTKEIEEEYKEQDPAPVCKWVFDQCSPAHWEELRQGNVDKTKSWVDFSDTEDGNLVTVVTDRTPGLTIQAVRDMWGTWITFKIGEYSHTIAQEDGTMSFMDALIASLTKLKEITDFRTVPPTLEEVKEGPDS
jgi:hypothetical protein